MCPAKALVEPTPAAADLSSRLFAHVYTARSATEHGRCSSLRLPALYFEYPLYSLSRKPSPEVTCWNGLRAATGQSPDEGVPCASGSQADGSSGGSGCPILIRLSRCVPLFPT